MIPYSSYNVTTNDVTDHQGDVVTTNNVTDFQLDDTTTNDVTNRQRDDVVLLGRPVQRRLVVLVDVIDARAEIEQRVDRVGVTVTRGDQQRREVVLVVLVDASAPGGGEQTQALVAYYISQNLI